MRTGLTKKNHHKAIQKETLRERLAAGGHVQHVLDISEKLANPDIEMDGVMVSRYKASADIKLKIIDKYLASLKAVEMSGTDGKPLLQGLTVTFVNANTDTD